MVVAATSVAADIMATNAAKPGRAWNLFPGVIIALILSSMFLAQPATASDGMGWRDRRLVSRVSMIAEPYSRVQHYGRTHAHGVSGKR
jgi:hypothetical protein